MPGYAPTQGHIASAVCYLAHALRAMRAGTMKRALFMAKGSLFLGRMTESRRMAYHSCWRRSGPCNEQQDSPRSSAGCAGATESWGGFGSGEPPSEFEEDTMKLLGKRVLVIGERDGVNAPAIEACVKSAGAEVLYAETLCFV